MNTTAEIQTLILAETGIKTSVKKLSGSVKNYIAFSPIFQNGKYPEFPFDWRRQFAARFSNGHDEQDAYCSGTVLHIHKVFIQEGAAIAYKKEHKPKPIEQQSQKTWGSKNSQLRLDKAGKRFSNRLRRDGRSYFM